MPRTRTKDTPVRPYTKASDPRSVRALHMVIDAELPVKLVALMHGFTPVALARKVSRARPSWPDDPESRAKGLALRQEIMDAFAALCPTPSAQPTAAAQALARPQTLGKLLSRALSRSLPAALSQAVSTALKEALPDGISLEMLQAAPPVAPFVPMNVEPQAASAPSTPPGDDAEQATLESTTPRDDAPQTLLLPVLPPQAAPAHAAPLMAPQQPACPMDRPVAPQPVLRPAPHHVPLPPAQSDVAHAREAPTHVMQVDAAPVASQHPRSESA